MKVGLRKKLKFFSYFWPENYSSWSILKRELNNRIASLTASQEFETINYRERDWDNLIVLDACRYDIFQDSYEDTRKLDGELKKVHSNASHTWNFLKKNFRNDNSDTVYVTASPMATGYGEHFHDIDHVWKRKWNNQKRTVLPKDVTEAALKANERYPNKKILIHYMQPHYPFIGEKAEDLEVMGSFEYGSRENPSIWERMQFENLDRQKVIAAYKENLQEVISELAKLEEELEGKTVVTSDHGNLLGSKVGLAPMKIYGHPPGVRDEELRSVPWLELSTKKRKEVEKEEKDKVTDHNEEEIKDKLSDLGYT